MNLDNDIVFLLFQVLCFLQLWFSSFLTVKAPAFAVMAILLLLYFSTFMFFLHSFLPTPPFPTLRYVIGFSDSITAFTSAGLLYAAANILHSFISLQWEMAQRMIATVLDCPAIRTALDVGCEKGSFFNSVVMQLKKDGTSGRVVGLDC
ncbi:S-adenosyl-L-methionine-dependent methyltransferase protein [Dioscorea alata]|uniref:S-adenosyl-L-methionine-dependent methyltransferase protein n=1 Tax=Dioscorea alata TaxID=55571 RepID=A0ACB7VQC9_DIOAL|nr:S-adenosyl-L-methionine-dependent methyltransferase protein [Dioscorea alata]